MPVRYISAAVLCLAAIALAGCSDGGKETVDSTEQAVPATGAVTVTIIDGRTGEPVPARVYARGSDDSLYVAEGCVPYSRPGFVSRIGYAGTHFTTLGQPFTLELPAGTARIVVERGKEYLTSVKTVSVVPGSNPPVEIMLDRWIDMNARGWYSGDLHVHRPLDDLAGLMRAEDLNVAVPQTVWGMKREPGLDSWLERAADNGVIAVDDNRAFSVLSHEIERFRNSAIFIHNTGKTELPVAEYEETNRTNMALIALGREAGGLVEVEKPWWPESHIDVALGKADFVGIANNHFTYRSHLPEHPRRRTEYRDDYPEGVTGYAAYVFDLYYAYLNCGFHVAPSAGSASGVLPNPLGYNRIYARVAGGFSYDAWFEAAKAGLSFVTNGPMLYMTVDRRNMGETVTVDNGRISVSCGVHTSRPLDRMEIILDGEVVETAGLGGGGTNTVLDFILDVDKSGWVAARCFEKGEDPFRFAHTAPVYIEVPGKPFRPDREAVSYFLKKTKSLVARAETGDYPDDAARDAAMGVYQSAAAFFENLLNEAE